jgi:hypothetical protein
MEHRWHMNIPMAISIVALAISLLSYGFAVYSWREANRPMVVARVTTESGGNMGISLNLLVENTGNRPAQDVELVTTEADVRSASSEATVPRDAERCFFSGIRIPVLANGRRSTNAFWHLGQADSWRAGAEIPVTVRYRDLNGRRFSNKQRLVLADDAGFAQTFWNEGYRDAG